MIELPLIVRIQLIVLPGAVLLVGIATILLYVRTRTRPALVMMVAVLLGLTAQALGYFGPRETVAASAGAEPSASDSRPRFISGVRTRNAWETPAFVLSMSSLVIWVGGFAAHSLTVARKDRQRS